MFMRTVVLFFIWFYSASLLAYGTFGPVYEKGKRVNPNETLLSAKDSKDKAAIINQHTGNPGCYILCVGPKGGLYPIGGTYDFHGLIRIKGHYNTDYPTTDRTKRFCYPDNIPGNQASYFTYYKKMCDDTFSTCNKYCNGNGDTGGFFSNTPIR